MDVKQPSMDCINQFREDRHWRPLHHEEALALLISIEGVAMLEIFQSKTLEEVLEDVEHLKEVRTDVLMDSYMVVDNLHLDVHEISQEKLSKNHMK